jgi:hypothetical protein
LSACTAPSTSSGAGNFRFYRDRRVDDYDKDGVPPEEHILVTRESFTNDLKKLLAGRSYEQLFSYPAQNLAIYQIFAKQ